jgi:hypothetical protein
MTNENKFEIRVKAAGVNIHRKVDEKVGRRVVSILLGGAEAGSSEDDSVTVSNGTGKRENRQAAPHNREAFFAERDSAKPSDNALATAAYHYSEYGSAGFTIDEMRQLADDVGVTIPERLDMTYLQAKRNGNRLFRRGGRNAFRPTVHGESFFKQTYNVQKGTGQKTPTAND